MKQGTAVHQALEDEVHITVPVDILKKEDSWGLRIWNVIQGLRTLRDTGRTRELEIWGSIGGEVVNGVIDELSYISPDPALEAYDGPASKNDAPPEYQMSINAYLLLDGKKGQEQSISDVLTRGQQQPLSKQEQNLKRIYITDFKTRKNPTLPTGPYLEPTVLQLHLYHHMLENLAQGNFSLIQLAERYNLDTNETFSDSFLAEIGSLNQEPFDSMPPNLQDVITTSQFQSSQDSMDILLRHNNLSTLWSFMMTQFRETFFFPSPAATETPTPTPQSISDLDPPAVLPTRLSPLLTAEYIAPNYNHVKGSAKKCIGKKSFMFNAAYLRTYLEDSLAFWRGEREPKGVELQEAFKCRMCDFRDDCSWIHERDAAAVQLAMERKKMREIAGMEGKVVATAKSTV
jgi:exonuclease V